MTFPSLFYIGLRYWWRDFIACRRLRWLWYLPRGGRTGDNIEIIDGAGHFWSPSTHRSVISGFTDTKAA
jgi:hypothetical protein